MKQDELYNEEFLNRLDLLKRNEEFAVPQNYFEQLTNSIEDKSRALEADDEFFLQQEESILFKIKMSSAKEELAVPSEYFAKSKKEILAKATAKSETKIFTLKRIVSGMAAAACIATAVFYTMPDASQVKTSSFETVLAETNMEENDYFSILTNDELNSLFFSELEDADDDFMAADEADNYISDENFEEIFSQEIKPSDDEYALMFEDITEDEMLDYLIDEIGDELYDY